METMSTDTPETNAAKRPSGLRACADGLDVNPDKDFAQKCMRHAADRMEQLERERDEARQWESQALVARIQRDEFSKTLGEVREILCNALPNENQLTSFMAATLVKERDEAREIASWWRDNWKKGRTVSMIASIKLPWENS